MGGPRARNKEELPKVGHLNRIVAFIPIDGYIEGHGFRVALVKEGEGRYYSRDSPSFRCPRHRPETERPDR